MKNTNIFYLYFAYSISNILMRFLKKELFEKDYWNNGKYNRINIMFIYSF